MHFLGMPDGNYVLSTFPYFPLSGPNKAFRLYGGYLLLCKIIVSKNLWPDFFCEDTQNFIINYEEKNTYSIFYLCVDYLLIVMQQSKRSGKGAFKGS